MTILSAEWATQKERDTIDDDYDDEDEYEDLDDDECDRVEGFLNFWIIWNSKKFEKHFSKKNFLEKNYKKVFKRDSFEFWSKNQKN